MFLPLLLCLFFGNNSIETSHRFGTDRNSRNAKIIQATPQNSHIIITTTIFSSVFFSFFFWHVMEQSATVSTMIIKSSCRPNLIEIQSFARKLNRTFREIFPDTSKVAEATSLIFREDAGHVSAEAFTRSKISTVFGDTIGFWGLNFNSVVF